MNNGEQQKFWEGLAHTWSLQNKNPVVGWYHEHEKHEDYNTILFDGIETQGAVALEYGCGPGRNLIHYAGPKWGFRTIDGVDISQKNIDNAYMHLKTLNITYPSAPVLTANDGKHIPAMDNLYDIVFSVICMQHINNHDVRYGVWQEIFRVLRPGGWFTAQMGFGPGHPRSVGFYDTPEVYHSQNHDVRVDKPEEVSGDLEKIGFVNFKYVLRTPCHDEHPLWIWFKAQKPE